MSTTLKNITAGVLLQQTGNSDITISKLEAATDDVTQVTIDVVANGQRLRKVLPLILTINTVLKTFTSGEALIQWLQTNVFVKNAVDNDLEISDINGLQEALDAGAAAISSAGTLKANSSDIYQAQTVVDYAAAVTAATGAQKKLITVTVDENINSFNSKYLYDGVSGVLRFISTARSLTKTRLYRFPLASDFVAEIGSGVTSTFTRNFQASMYNLNTGVYSEAAHLTARFENQAFKTEVAGSSLIAYSENRDLTAANWVKSSATVLKNATGVLSDSNSASTLTATGASATVLYPKTVAAAVRNFNCFVKRKTGTGKIELTVDGGTTGTDITALINTSTFTRLSLPCNGINPSVGFRISTSGDEIYVDAVNVEPTSWMSSPMISRTDRGTEAESLSGLSGIDIRNNVYEIKYTATPITGGKSFGLIGSLASPANFFAVGKSEGVDTLTLQIIQASVIRANLQLALYYSNILQDQEYEVRIIAGYNEVAIYINNVFIGKKFYYAATGTISLDTFTLTGNYCQRIRNVEINRLAGKSVVTFEGDSITAVYSGVAAASGSPMSTGLLDKEFKNVYDNYVFRNISAGGSRIADAQTRLTTDVTPYVYSDAVKNILLVRMGINDVLNDATGASMLTAMQAYLTAVKAANPTIKIVLCDLLPFSYLTTAGRQTQRTAYNAGLPGLTGYDVFCTLSSISQLQTPTDTTYYIDGLHTQPLSEVTYVIPLIKAAIFSI